VKLKKFWAQSSVLNAIEIHLLKVTKVAWLTPLEHYLTSKTLTLILSIPKAKGARNFCSFFAGSANIKKTCFVAQLKGLRVVGRGNKMLTQFKNNLLSHNVNCLSVIESLPFGHYTKRLFLFHVARSDELRPKNVEIADCFEHKSFEDPRFPAQMTLSTSRWLFLRVVGS
jgi:hypothetical protein